MKKIMTILFSLILFMGVSFQTEAQTLVKSDQVIHYTYDDTLIKDATFNVTYYIKDFAENARIQVVTDTMASASDTVSIQTIVSRSMNNVDFHSGVGDTILNLAVDSSGHKSSTALLQSIYANYLKVTVKAIDSTQNAKVQYYLLFDKND